jgi:OPA family glycerol-3-phosphate transporter-like MFS transporter
MFRVDLFLVKDTPKDAGFENFNTGDATSGEVHNGEPLKFGELVTRVFTNPVIMTLAVSEFCTGFVRQGLLLWFVPFLSEVHKVEHGTALFTMATSGVTVGGIVGGILCGVISDKLFQSRRPPVAFIFYLGQIVSLFILGRTASPVVASFMIGFSCMWIFGVHGMLTGTASMDFGGTRAASTVAGLLDGVQYLASGLTGFLMGHFLDKWGWGSWTYMIMPFSLMGALLMTRLWYETPLRKNGAH